MARSRRRIRWWWFVIAGVVVLVGAFLVGRHFLYHDTTTAIDPEDALSRFRASTTTAAGTIPSTAPPARLPAPGVYQYATTGEEHVDALGGATHVYPAVTTITVTPSRCGVLMRWDALEERWTSRQVCADASGIVASTDTSFHRFYGQDDMTDAVCSPSYVFLPAVVTPGASWTASCSDGKTQESITITSVGVEPVVVGGHSVDAVRLTWAETDHASDTDGTVTADRWLAVADGLLLRETSRASSTTSTVIGDVHYREQYELILSSLTPAT
jgi:hypothetical protein